jgi:hypothetical protein
VDIVFERFSRLVRKAISLAKGSNYVFGDYGTMLARLKFSFQRLLDLDGGNGSFWRT